MISGRGAAPEAMHLHLDPVGGIAGDMFVAALLDAFPALEAELRAALEASGLGRCATIARLDHEDGVQSGSRFVVDPGPEGAGRTRGAAEIARLIAECGLEAGVRARAAAVFSLLAEAESQVHAVPLDAVHFHEVGGWDTIADVVSAAWLIERLGASGWSAAPLPLGRGRVESAHGTLPVPAPATLRLLEGMPVHDDGRAGERVTPTGAALLRHLAPSFEPLPGPLRLVGSGSGFGTRTLEGLSNVLRLLAFEPVPSQDPAGEGGVTVYHFEVDDQSPEDLAVALERLRALDGVLDVVQAPVFGKKGRLGAQVQMLAHPAARARLIDEVFAQTTTLGVRWHEARRAVLARETVTVRTSAGPVRVKRARRPDGRCTFKAEMDDIAALADERGAREGMRRAAESAARAGQASDGEPRHEA